MRTLLAAAVPLLFAAPLTSQGGVDPAARDLAAAFEAQGIHVDLERRLVSIRARVCVKEDLLEYVLVNPHGAAHESLFVTDVGARALNAALLALGVAPGQNARWVKREPAPTTEELRAGAPAWDIVPPVGDGFFLYVGWKVDGETYFFRLDDLLCDRSTGASMRRHAWVFLGSRLVRMRGGNGADEGFAAELDGNLVNLAFFEQGNTLATAALPECVQQTVWMPNGWLVPERHSPVELVFARERLAAPPPALLERLPSVVPSGAEATPR